MVRTGAGFTIVELLIVIVVIAILATVTIIAYNGIRDRAQQSANLEVLDQLEKGVRLYQAENGTMPPVYDQEDIDYVTAQTPPNQAQQLDQALANYRNGISTPQPVRRDSILPFCTPGDYPVTSIFREGECYVMDIVTVFNSPHLEIHERTSYVASKGFAKSIAPKYLSKAPRFTGDTFGYVGSSTGRAQSFSPPSGGDISGNGSMSVTFASRGAVYLSAFLYYYAKGDQSCGRGAKGTMSLGQMIAEANQEAASMGWDPSTYSYSGLGGDVWTQCVIMIQ